MARPREGGAFPDPSPADWPTRYAAAQDMLLAQSGIRNAAVYPHWSPDGETFWYERIGTHGREFRLVEARSGKATTVFTLAEVATKLAAHLNVDVDLNKFWLSSVSIDPQSRRATFNAFGEGYAYDYSTGTLTVAPKRADAAWLVSPDGRHAAFLREGNLWIRDLATEEERALTTDGEPFFAYADTPAAMRVVRARLGATPEGRWSPDSRYLFTLQVDDRHVPELPFLNFAPVTGVRPTVSANRTSLPGDERVTEFHMLAIDVATGRQVRANYPPLSAVRMNDTPFAANMAWWGQDGHTAYFVAVERGERAAHVVEFNVETGATRVLFSESAESYIELSVNVYAPALIQPLPDTNELVWYSERTGRGHLYLYDLNDGALKHPITQGDWQIREVLHVDAARREVFFLAAGIAPDEDPYVCKPCTASLDRADVRVVSASPGEHLTWRAGEFGLVMRALQGDDRFAISGLSPNGEHFVETVGGVDRLPTTSLRRRTGEEIAVLETAEGSRLPDGWDWPEPVSLLAADGRTRIHGLLFKPPGFDLAKSYPLIDLIYGGPQVNVVPKAVFNGDELRLNYVLESAHLAQLGCFVLLLDGRGTANRERAFREASSGAVHTASNLEDHIAAIRQLAAAMPSIDLDRVGITGFSGGGYATALAALQFGDFFKVAVAGGGNYDQALFWHSWGERYHGPFSVEHYRTQAASTYVSGLQGKLLLIHGLQDSGCHPAGLFQLVQALIEENKDFDLVVMPRAAHELTAYGARRRLDYFVTHLFDGTPPPGVKLKLPTEELIANLGYNAARPTARHATS